MPLVRVEVRNYYGLGVQELYREVKKEDPTEILDGVTVAGLVGILRQLGDLAEFAAEVFHGLQEELMVMSYRSHNMRVRTKQIESALSPLEKVVLSQRSHLHFAYTTGSNWHAHIQCDQNHFVYSDIPQFIMDSYEDCRSPPRLQLLDRFDPGGPGSCLKRYSDPNLFKRESVASGEVSDEKVAKDKQRLKIKKKKLWDRNGELAQGASFSHHDGRKQVTRFNVGHNTQVTRLIVGNNTTQTMSDLDDQSSLDLRNGSAYNEGDFHPCHCTEESGSRESISSPVKRHYVDDEFLDYIFLQEKFTDADDYIQINLSQDQVGITSPSITWDEKIEALEPKAQDHNCDRALRDYHDKNQESFYSKHEVETLGDTSLNFETVGKMDSQPYSKALPTLEPDEVHLDDIESETDCLMDATGTIESDHQICRKRQEIEHLPKLGGKAVDSELEIGKHNLECHSSYSESDGLVHSSMYNDSSGHDPSSMSPKSTSVLSHYYNPVAMKDVFGSMCSAEKVLLQAQKATKSMNLSSLQCVDSFETVKTDGITNEESVASTSFCSFRDDNSGAPMINRTGGPVHQKPAIKTSDVTPVRFWTNGGLLGLEPSKPPELNVKNGIPKDLASSQYDYGDKDLQKMFKNFETGFDDQSFMCQEHRESGTHFRKPSWKISPADLGINLGITSYSLSPDNTISTEARTMAPRTSLPVNSMFQAAKKGEENSRSSVRIADLVDPMQTTGSNKILLHGREDNSYPSGYLNNGYFERDHNQSVAYKKNSGCAEGLFGCESSIPSSSSSPPLGHLKISFQPIDGFETSKLKLKFLDRNLNNETNRDIFPSFQLVPEISIIQQNIGSDSDNDTFCRSSSSLSDDCLSHQSESNSVQWESGQLHCGKDLELYDELHRISLTQSAETDNGNGRSHREIHYGLQFPCVDYGEQISGRMYDSQSLEPQSEFTKEPRKFVNTKDIVKQQGKPTPTTPPPPQQWRGMESHLDDKESKREAFIDGSYFEFDLKFSPSTSSQQPKPAPSHQYQDMGSAKMRQSKQSELQTSSRRREANQLKGIDEKEDFLQQIRSKSLNLRPTVIGKPKYEEPTSNAHVSAILRKVNAIRQVVGSDDGGEGDSNWSDT